MDNFVIKVELRSKTIKWDKEGHIILIKTIIYNEDVIVNIYALSNSINFHKAENIGKETCKKHTVKTEDFNSPPTDIDRSK